ncbi:hypothetical protein HPB49_013043 [Dermacentor silvarum]|uniref:Uncharacterized protein n=1 Tax=Dermacentor silvarum TaxID=543639 RepID=A0ACB8CF32_DERSI|nr:hypothetical protein HPB49_013043 [Dermacentor silvarum]
MPLGGAGSLPCLFATTNPAWPCRSCDPNSLTISPSSPTIKPPAINAGRQSPVNLVEAWSERRHFTRPPVVRPLRRPAAGYAALLPYTTLGDEVLNPAHMAVLFANVRPFLDVPDTPPILGHKWEKIFQVHLTAAGGSGWEDERRASALISALGIEGQPKYFAAQEQLEAQGVQNAPCTTSTPATLDSGVVSTTEAAATTEFDTLLQFLERLFAETTNVLAERHLFTSREQLPGETFLEFVAALKDKALSCKFGATYDDRARDQIIHGVANAHVGPNFCCTKKPLRCRKQKKLDATWRRSTKPTRHSDRMKGYSARSPVTAVAFTASHVASQQQHRMAGRLLRQPRM